MACASCWKAWAAFAGAWGFGCSGGLIQSQKYYFFHYYTYLTEGAAVAALLPRAQVHFGVVQTVVKAAWVQSAAATRCVPVHSVHGEYMRTFVDDFVRHAG